MASDEIWRFAKTCRVACLSGFDDHSYGQRVELAVAEPSIGEPLNPIREQP